MSRFSEYTIKEILCWLNINDPDCGNKVCTMNRILREFYTHIAWTKLAKQAVAFSGSGNITIQFNHKIKQVHDFIVKGKCVNQKCFQILENCGSYCSDPLYQMFMQEVWSTPAVGQYYITQGTGWVELKTNIHSWVTDWWVVYSRWPEELTSINDTIQIDDNALILLELLIMKIYAERDRDANMAQWYKNQFNELLALEKLNQERLPYRIIWLHQEYSGWDKTHFISNSPY